MKSLHSFRFEQIDRAKLCVFFVLGLFNEKTKLQAAKRQPFNLLVRLGSNPKFFGEALDSCSGCARSQKPSSPTDDPGQAGS
jgi:hypothetical protein